MRMVKEIKTAIQEIEKNEYSPDNRIVDLLMHYPHIIDRSNGLKGNHE